MALQGGRRRDRHDRAVPFHEVRYGVLDRKERAGEVHLQHEQEVVELDLAQRLEVPAVEDAGAGHDAVEAAERVHRARDRGRDITLVPDVRRRGDRAAARGRDLARRVRGGVGGAVDHGDGRALAGEENRGGAPDAARAAGDEHAPRHASRTLPGTVRT